MKQWKYKYIHSDSELKKIMASWEDAGLTSKEHIQRAFELTVPVVDMGESELKSPPPGEIWMDARKVRDYVTWDTILKDSIKVAKFGFATSNRYYSVEVQLGPTGINESRDEQIEYIKKYGLMGHVARLWDSEEGSDTQRRGSPIQASDPLDFVESALEFIQNDKRKDDDDDEPEDFSPDPSTPDAVKVLVPASSKWQLKYAQVLQAYKIVAFDGNRAYSLNFPEKTVDVSIGTVDHNIYLGTTSKFCIDHYSNLTDDNDLLLTYSFNEDDILQGSIEEDGEILVKNAKLSNVQQLEKQAKTMHHIKESESTKKFTTEEAKEIGEKIGIDWNDCPFPLEEFRMGLEIEMEHGSHDSDTDVIGNDYEKSGKIAWAHLKELTDYYTKLKEMESHASSKWQIKFAELEKEAMSQLVGAGDLNNDTWNVDWDVPDASEKAQAVAQKILTEYRNFFLQSLQSQSEDNFVIGPVEKSVEFKKYQPTCVLSVNYLRRILPIHNGEAYNIADNNIKALDQLIPGIKQFVEDLEANNIPLNPFFHKSRFSASKGGGFNQQKLHNFIAREREKYYNNPLRMSNGANIPSSVNFYLEHQDRIESGGSVRMTEHPKATWLYSNDDVDNITHQPYLLRAIANKFRQGYRLDQNGLDEDVNEKMKERMSQLGLIGDERIIRSYNNMFNRIVQTFEEASRFIRSDEASINPNLKNYKEYYWGESEEGFYPGLRYQGQNKQRKSLDLTLEELRLILKNLTIYSGEGTERRYRPDQFFVPDHTLEYSSNGWDTPGGQHNPEGRMLLMPALRTLPNGEIMYDRDHGNFGRSHLVKNWEGLKNMLLKYGHAGFIDRAMEALQTKEAVEQFPEESLRSWANIVGSARYGNRTNAETFLEIINRYPNWEDFYRHHIASSYAAQRQAYNKILESQDAELFPYVQAFQNGTRSWEDIADILNNVGAVKTTPEETAGSISSEEDFNLLKQYGYQMAKFMDFISGIMFTSCKETLEQRIVGRKTQGNLAYDEVYGRHYSTSSGIGEGGEIVLGMTMALSSPQFVKKDQSGVTVKITEKLHFVVTEGGKRSQNAEQIFEGTSWRVVFDDFMRRFPELPNQLGEIVPAMHENIQQIEIELKKALDYLRKEAEQQFGTGVTIIYEENEGYESVIDAADLEAEEVVNGRELTDPTAVSPATEDLGEVEVTDTGEQWSMEYPKKEPATPEEEIRLEPEEEIRLEPEEKPMLSQDFVGKRDKPNKTIKHKITKSDKMTEGIDVKISVIEKLGRVAKIFDQRGILGISDKIDYIINKIAKN